MTISSGSSVIQVLDLFFLIFRSPSSSSLSFWSTCKAVSSTACSNLRGQHGDLIPEQWRGRGVSPSLGVRIPNGMLNLRPLSSGTRIAFSGWTQGMPPPGGPRAESGPRVFLVCVCYLSLCVPCGPPCKRAQRHLVMSGEPDRARGSESSCFCCHTALALLQSWGLCCFL